MFNLLFLLIVAVFVAMLFVNVIFRVKVFKAYKYLVQNKVEFTASHFFNRAKLEAEVFTKYPSHKPQIERFIKLIHQSVQLASVLIVIIIIFGYLLMRFK